MSVSKKLKDFFSSLLPEKMKISEIILEKEVVEDIIDFANANYPREFVSLLQGKVEEDKLTVSNLIYQKYASSFNTATMQFNLPMISDVVGSVHSHPSPSNRPSNADLNFFDRKGIVHIIISYPFKENNIACYDYAGNRLEFRISSK